MAVVVIFGHFVVYKWTSLLTRERVARLGAEASVGVVVREQNSQFQFLTRRHHCGEVC